jgi:hypothetical protein
MTDDARRIRELLLARVAELAPYLFPNGHREGKHWRVANINGDAGDSFDICIEGTKAGWWGDFADSERHSRSLVDLWMKARNVDFKTALHEAAQWLGMELSGRSNFKKGFPSLGKAIAWMAKKLKMRTTRQDIYHDGNGGVHFVVARFDGKRKKDFAPFHRDENGGWRIADPPGDLPLFNLPKLLVPDFKPSPVFLVEGEKCACVLEQMLDVLATTSAHGSKGARKTDWEPLAGRDVVILPDNDKTGDQDYAATGASLLLRLSPQAKVKIVKLPGLPEKGDIADWIAQRNGKPAQEIKAELFELVNKAKLLREAPETESSRDDSEWSPEEPKVEVRSHGQALPAGLEKEPALQSDDETIARLAALPVLEYERTRKTEAEKLGCRESVLDNLVSAKRLLANPANDALQGAAVKLADVEPWPKSVNGAAVLDQIAKRTASYVVMPPGGADAIALWDVHSHCFDVFMHTPRLNVSSADKNSGKTTLRDVCAEFVARPLLTENTTSAVLFRLVHAQAPTLLADEYDSWMKENEELRGLLNAGHRRGAIVHRCEGEGFEVRGFAVFAPVMLCGIGALPGTLHDRSIVIRLPRAKRGEIKARFDSRHVEVENELRRKLARWIADNRERIAACEPQLPEGMFNRVADNWRPLFAIAEVAGGNWPQRCADAYAKLSSGEFEDVETLRVALLTDIQQIFAGTWPPLDEGQEPKPIERIFSKDLCEKLADMKERPWPEVCRGKPITECWLARNLAAFGIRSKNIRTDEKQAKGYEIDDFNDAFDRYVMPQKPYTPPFQASHRPNTRENARNLSVPNKNFGTDEKSDFTRVWDVGTDKKGESGEKGVSDPSFGPPAAGPHEESGLPTDMPKESKNISGSAQESAKASDSEPASAQTDLPASSGEMHL